MHDAHQHNVIHPQISRTRDIAQVRCTAMAERVLVIDNYDSFVYILVQYLGELGANPLVVRHDEIAVHDIAATGASRVLISPGPGTPDDAGISLEVVKELGGVLPIFGVCLGLQCIGQAFGASVVRAPQVMHGKTSFIDHNNGGVFAGLQTPLEATRYHSLIVDRDTVPAVLEVTAESSDGLVMGLKHRNMPIEGVQFHPESIVTTGGHEMVRNFLATTTAP